MHIRTVIDRSRKRAMPSEEMLFQPELIDAMHTAFVGVCPVMRLRPGSSESDLVALRILDLAKAGVHDVRKLSSLAPRGMDIPID
jgi:hypothetical protein